MVVCALWRRQRAGVWSVRCGPSREWQHCARLDLLGFELCSPEVLLDLQDLDHELPPTTRELVQALGITVDEDDEAACDGSSAPTTLYEKYYHDASHSTSAS